ncbi:hypothetical protein NL676_011303 [Syzygium grande]|nr:hypothetical protein NL676_011303 [Syzygium grande]
MLGTDEEDEAEKEIEDDIRFVDFVGMDGRANDSQDSTKLEAKQVAPPSIVQKCQRLALDSRKSSSHVTFTPSLTRQF